MLRKSFAAAIPVIAATLLAGCCTAQERPGLPGKHPANDPRAGTHTYNIRDFGAIPDGKTLNTKALQAAIDACTADHGGTVLVPAGTFLIGTIQLKSDVTLHVAAGAVLLGSGDGKDYHGVDAIPLRGDSTLGDGHWALIYAVGAKNVTIEGPGMIDGNGARFHPPERGMPNAAGLGGNRRPYLTLFYHCNNLTIRDIDLFRSGYHMVRVIQSAYCNFDNIHIYNRVAGNNDGFHFISAEHVSINNCKVESQDDACALFGSCKFITITNSTFSTRWSVFRFGGGSADNITVSNCILSHVNGCPFKFQASSGSVFQNISFSNIVLDEVTGPISISVGPRGFGRPGRRGATQPASQPSSQPRIPQDVIPEDTTQAASQPTTQRAPALVRNISFSNIHGTVTTNPGPFPDIDFGINYNPGEKMSAIVLNCVGDATMENISFDNIHLTFGGGGTAADAAHLDVAKIAGEYFDLGVIPAYGLYARNVHGITLNNVRFEVASAELRPAMILDHVHDVSITNFAGQANKDADALLRFFNCKDILLTAPRVLTPAATFLHVQGADSANIVIDGGDFSNASRPFTATDSAADSAVKIRP